MAQPSTTYYAVLRERGENWDARRPMRQQEQWEEHAAFMDAPHRRRLRRPGRSTWRGGENPAHHCCWQRASHRGPTRGRSLDASRVVASRKSRALGNPPEHAPVANNLTALKLVAQFVGISTILPTGNGFLAPPSAFGSARTPGATPRRDLLSSYQSPWTAWAILETCERTRLIASSRSRWMALDSTLGGKPERRRCR